MFSTAALLPAAREKKIIHGGAGLVPLRHDYRHPMWEKQIRLVEQNIA